MKSFQSRALAILLVLLSFMAVQGWSAEPPLKKIVFIKDDDGDFFGAVNDLIFNLLKEKGWNETNSQFTTLSMKGNEVNVPALVAEVKRLKPDVVLINNTLIHPIAVKLKAEGIPFVAGGGLEWEDETGKLMFVGADGKPTTNLTGTFTLPRPHLENTFRMLQQISPLQGKKVVFATGPSAAFTAPKVKAALAKIGATLKDFKLCRDMEDFEAFVAQYNADPEVAWILTGEMIKNSRDGSPFSLEAFYVWERAHNKKISVSFWESGVSNGMLFALGIDSMTTVRQMISMADRLLKGAPLSQVIPEDPSKTLILLNQARAKAMGVEFPIPVLRSAWRVYTDYQGHFIEKK